MNRQSINHSQSIFHFTHIVYSSSRFIDHMLFKDHFMSIHFLKTALFLKSSFYMTTVLAFGLVCSLQSDPLLAKQAPVPTQPSSGASVKEHPQLPGTSASDLAENAQRALIKLMSEGPCPCDPKQTLLVCIQAKSCKHTYLSNKWRQSIGFPILTNKEKNAIVI